MMTQKQIQEKMKKAKLHVVRVDNAPSMKYRNISDASWNEEYANEPTIDGQEMVVGGDIFLPMEGMDFGDGVVFYGVRNLVFAKTLSIWGGPTVITAHKEDANQDAYAVYAIESRIAVIKF